MPGSHSLTTILLLVTGPTLALIYSLAVTIFYAIWRECQLHDKCMIQVPRLSLMVLVWAILQASYTLSVAVLIVVVIAINLLAVYLIRQTRVEEVAGGPPPRLPIPPFTTSSSSTAATTIAAVNGSYGTNNNHNDNNNNNNKLLIVVTGANAGIGKETCKALVQHYSAVSHVQLTIIMACRDVKRAEAARQELLSYAATTKTTTTTTTTNIQLELLQLDLASLESVRGAVDKLKQRLEQLGQQKIDILINNAGLMMEEKRVTVDGYELTMQANHLGHYLWTRLLLPCMNDTRQSRILNLTSSTYRLARIENLQDLFCEHTRKYTIFGQYATTKLCNILFTTELARRLEKSKKNIAVHAIHPGLVRTDVVKNLPWIFRILNQVFAFILATMQKTPAEGAYNTLHVALCLASDEQAMQLSGSYWVNRKVQALNAVAQNQQAAKQLWKESARLVGLSERDNDDDFDGGDSSGDDSRRSGERGVIRTNGHATVTANGAR